MCQTLFSVFYTYPRNNPMCRYCYRHFIDDETKHKGTRAIKVLSSDCHE